MNTNVELTGKIAIVTGGASGIGHAISTGLAKDGALVVVADINEKFAKTTASELEAQGLRATAFQVDVSNSTQVARLVRYTIQTFGKVDILVNNAGIGQSKPILEMLTTEWDHIMAVNLKGAFLCAQSVAQEMVTYGTNGRIINIVSTAAQNARVSAAAYCASKAGLLQFTRVLALELGPHGITANAVGPGLTLTESSARSQLSRSSKTYQRAFLKEVPLTRPGSPSDIVQAVIFLASERANYITGQVLYVDGGYSAGKLSVHD